MTAALVPANHRRFEQALADTLQPLQRTDPTVIETIWNAWTCPPPLLPFLAYALSVDLWDDEWSEIDKRRAIADSPAYHRRKGTRLAVEQALDLLGRPYTLTEWWQRVPEGRRGTARVFLTVDRLSDAPAVVARARRLVSAAKPKSRAVAIDAGLVIPGEIVVGAIHTQHWIWTVAAHVPAIPETVGTILISAAVGVRWTWLTLGEGAAFPAPVTADSTVITTDSTVITADNMGASGL